MRQNPIPFIPKQAASVAPSKTERNVAVLLGLAGQLTQAGMQLELQEQQQENEKQAAMLKIQQLGQDENQRFSQIQKQEQIRELQRTEYAANAMTQEFERASAKINKIEKQGIYSVVNGLSDEQLSTANARGLGFTTPEAILLADQAIGERQANADFPRLLESIELDESKLPSEHLDKFIKGRSLGSESSTVSYAATLADRISRYETAAVVDRAKKARGIAAQNAIDGFQFNIATGFETLDKAQFQQDLSGLYRGLKAADPGLTEKELKATAVGALQPLFLGDGARFSAAEGLVKLNELFTAEESERFGLGEIRAELEKRALAEHQHAASGVMKLAQRQIEAAPGHDAVKLVMASALADLRLDGLQKQELQQIAEERFAQPDYLVDVQKRFGLNGSGDRSIAMSPAHDRAIASFLAQRETLPNYTKSDRLRESAAVFGRILEQDINEINSLIYSGDAREAVSRFATIREANPSLARSLENKVSDKAYSLSLLASLGVANADGFISEFAQVPEDAFANARKVIKDERTESGDKLDRLVSKSVRDLALSAADGSGSAVMDMAVQDTYQQLVYAGIARTIAAEGMLRPEELFARGEAFASNVLRKHVGSVKIGQDKYVLPQSDMRRYGFAEADGQYLQGVSELWSYQQRDLEASFGGDVLLDFSNAQELERGGVIYMGIPIRVRDQLLGDAEIGLFEFPRSSSVELKKLLNSEKKRESIAMPNDVRSLTQNPRFPR